MVKNTLSYKYYIKDHLGNNRVVADHQGNVMQYTHYYPYGGMLYSSTEPGYQNFKYNGKEYDTMHGLNEYDYGARQYDPAIAQFTSMDPLSEKYYHISPYAYCGRNPVNRVDPDGMDWYERDGKRIWRNSVDGTYTDKQGNEWTNIGHTYTDSKTGMYYSLFGQKYTKSNKDLNAIKTIDTYVQSYAKYLANYDECDKYSSFSDSELPSMPTQKANMYEYKNTSFKEMLFEEVNNHIFSYGGDKNNALVRMTRNNQLISEGIVLRGDRTTVDYFGHTFHGKGIWLKNKQNFELVTILFSAKTGVRNNIFFNKLITSWTKGKWKQ